VPARASSTAATTAARGAIGASYPNGRRPGPRRVRAFPVILGGPSGGGMRSSALAFVLTLLPPAVVHAPPPRAYEDLAVELLRQYLRIDTTNPPGNELQAARFFEKILAE